MTTKVKVAGAHAATVAVGGALTHAGLLVFLAALVIGLARLGIEPWLSVQEAATNAVSTVQDAAKTAVGWHLRTIRTQRKAEHGNGPG